MSMNAFIGEAGCEVSEYDSETLHSKHLFGRSIGKSRYCQCVNIYVWICYTFMYFFIKEKTASKDIHLIHKKKVA